MVTPDTGQLFTTPSDSITTHTKLTGLEFAVVRRSSRSRTGCSGKFTRKRQLAPHAVLHSTQTGRTHHPKLRHNFSSVKLAVLDFFPTATSVLRPFKFPPSQPRSSNPNTATLSTTLLQRSGLTFAQGVKSSPSPPAATSGRPPSSGRTAMDAVDEHAVALPPPPVVQSAERKMNLHITNSQDKKGRRRRSSSLMFHEPPESLEQQSDQAVLPNLNSQWVNAKGV